MPPTPKRVKIKPVFPTNLFFEKVLAEWKAQAMDTKGKKIFKKALDNLKVYPLPLENYTHLRTIRGIGEDIATRLEASLECFREREGDVTLVKVRALKRGAALVYLREAKVTKGKKAVPFLSPAVSQPALRLPAASQQPSSSSIASSSTQVPTDPPTSPQPTTSSSDLNQSFSQPVLPSTFAGVPPTQPPTTSPSAGRCPSSPARKKAVLPVSDALVEHDPELFPAATVTLIVDGRENRPGRAKTISDHLAKHEVVHELRPLSVGDYLWVVKLGPGAENEMLLDFVVERKTWDDLKSSIRHSRYAEQKQRLQQSGIKNVVLVVEGNDKNTDRSLEQALATSSLENGFLIQRTANVAATARFLADVTAFLQRKVKNEVLSGHSFAWLQDESRKTKEITVQDCFLRQLTVCPQLSAMKARDVANRFPSLRSLYLLYKNAAPNVPLEEVLGQAVPSIPPAVSKQMSLFFADVYAPPAQPVTSTQPAASQS
ncbi:Crossover junction endonuclease MUS81 [Aphelenchoides fujianensis]|nr:Crossover junction endonuclease MUS81 [Aphelenchoides fujianensis]